MARTNVTADENTAEAVAAAVAEFRRGGVVVFPTETVYGIGVAANNPEALAALRGLKSRSDEKPFQYLVGDMAMAARLGAVFSPRAAALARAFWPGPLTIVVPGASGGTLGIRIPDSPFILAVCAALGRPIISSSANPAGDAPPRDAATADAFGDQVDLLVDGGVIAEGIPSTVVVCDGDDYRILRSGGTPDEAIDAVWRGADA